MNFYNRAFFMNLLSLKFCSEIFVRSTDFRKRSRLGECKNMSLNLDCRLHCSYSRREESDGGVLGSRSVQRK